MMMMMTARHLSPSQPTTSLSLCLVTPPDHLSLNVRLSLRLSVCLYVSLPAVRSVASSGMATCLL